jgi:hypothetical protein
VISVWLGGGRKFETIGRVAADSPFEYLRELAVKRIRAIKRERLPRTPLRQLPEATAETLRRALSGYVAAYPELSERTIEDYQDSLERGFGPQMDQPASLLVSDEILRLNSEHLEVLTKNDPTNKPPVGYWRWQGTLRILRTVLG